MAFLTALLGAVGGYGAGRQQALQNKQNQQQIDAQNAYEQEQIALDKQKQKLTEDAYQRNLGIDPATGKPFVMPPALLQVRPNNAGKGGAVTDPEEINHLYRLADFFSQTGQTDRAAATMDRAKTLEGIYKNNQSLNLRELLDYYNQGQQNARTAETIAGANTRTGETIAGALQRTLDTIAGANERNIRTTDTSMANTASRNATSIATTGMRDATSIANTQAHIAQQKRQQTDIDVREMKKQNATALRNKQPVPYQNLDDFETGLGPAITAVSKDPSKLQLYINNLNARAGIYGPALTQYGRDQLNDAARQSTAATKTGGSQATGNPSPPPQFQNP